ncbi:lipid A core-O-antigen ligase-like enyme [Rhodoplanes sp. Z2-YC6860]|nr:lipid A core-O-antigen ligase-like enyme [Rhodoplanes sp. Z2-YC6860]
MQGSERESRLDRGAAYVLLFAIAGAPLPLGSRSPVAVALWCVVLALGLLLASPRKLHGGQLALLCGIGLVVLCFGFVLHEQLSSHPWIGRPNPIWAKASEALGTDIPPSVSIVRGEPFYAMGPSLSCLLALTLGLIVGTGKHRADQALQVMAYSGLACAVFGLVSLGVDFAKMFGRDRISIPGSVTATFVNRNTAAAYLGSVSIVWLVLFLSAFRRRLPPGPIVWSKVFRRITSESTGQLQWMLRLGALFVCLTAMFLTSSRGGVLTSLFSVAVVIALFFRRDLRHGKSVILLLIGAGAIALALLELFGSAVQSRIASGGLVEQGRLEAYRSSLRIIADQPWFGSGLGTFTEVFPAYRSGNITSWGTWNLAHSTPFEMAIEVGVPLTVIFAVAWLVALLVLLRGTGRSRTETVVPLAALGVASIALMHSSIDFSLQISGYAIVVFALVGVGLAQSFQGEGKSGLHRQDSKRTNSKAAKQNRELQEIR